MTTSDPAPRTARVHLDGPAAAAPTAVDAPVVAILRLPEGAGLDLPEYMTAQAAGADCRAALDAPRTLAPGERALIPLGFAIALPPGFEAQLRPRSGLALKHGVTLLNAPGTIDADYRGPVGAVLVNLGPAPHTIARGDRVAQLVVAPVARARFLAVDALPESGRGVGGFGSTGFGAGAGGAAPASGGIVAGEDAPP